MVALLVGQIVEQTVAPYTWFPWVIVAWVALCRRARSGWRRRARASSRWPARCWPPATTEPPRRWCRLMGCVIGIDVGSQSVKAVRRRRARAVAGDGERALRDDATRPAAGPSRTRATGRRR